MNEAARTDQEALVSNAITRSPLAMILTDAQHEDMPITYVNDAFEKLTLYSRDFAVGRNCRFLQGPETDPNDVQRIRDGLASGQEFEVRIVNHRADGARFRNHLLVAPISGEDGLTTAHFGLLREVPDVEGQTLATSQDAASLALLRELQHRVKNHLAMIVSMIRVQARREVTPDSLKSIGRRIEALSVLYDELLNGEPRENGEDIAAGAYLERITSVVTSLQPRGAISVNVECEDIMLPVDHAARLGLLLSEFLTNALEHAFVDRAAGFVEVRFRRLSHGGVRLSVADDGVGMPEGTNWPFGAPSIESQRERAAESEGALDTTGHDRVAGVGGSIVAALTTSLDATLSVTLPGRGTVVSVEF
jgi:PAS domain S-box-containing protein